MNITPEQIPDEVVDAALFCTPINEYGEDMEMPIDAMGLGSIQQLPRARLIMKAALAAALPVLLGEAVGWMRRNITYKDTEGRRGGERILSECKVLCDDIPLYTLPTPETPNAHP